MLRLFSALACAGVLLGGCAVTRPIDLARVQPIPEAAPDPSSPPALGWRVVNRFRLISGQEEEVRFRRSLAALTEEYKQWYRLERTVGSFPNILSSDLLHVDELGPRRNFRTNYNTRTASYRCSGEASDPLCRDGGDWISDPARQVEVGVAVWAGADCDWMIDGEASVGRCDRRLIQTQLDQTTDVAVRRLGGGETDWLRTGVRVRDVRIVAMGESYSAGEGSPHAQWRILEREHRPAVWLDPRCHRSLLSGPSLTAAYLAHHNPQLSVTLLHYGCSGASIADGVATPWAFLETAARVENRNARFEQRPGADQAVARIGLHDIPPSQVEQARLDLTLSGAPRLTPDIILLSVGGNDVGFGGLVAGVSSDWLRPADLRPPAETDRGGTPDRRPVASFDQAVWSRQARGQACASSEPMDCMIERVRDRIGDPDNPEPGTLTAQYGVLAPYLAELTGGQTRRVMISHYPNFMRRAREERDGPPETGDASGLIGCHDRPFDGRPGLVPGILAWLPNTGVNSRDADRAYEELQTPLNAAVTKAARDHGWTLITTHVENGEAHGYCANERYYNTIVDSFWNQGRTYEADRPLGNFEVVNDDARFGLRAGERVIWSHQSQCFKRYRGVGDGEMPCLVPLQGQRPAEVYVDYAREQPQRGPLMPERGGPVASTGPVHPNLFGHCNYAGAMISQIVLENPSGIPFDPAFEQKVRAEGPRGLTANDVCDAKAWDIAIAATGQEGGRPDR